MAAYLFDRLCYLLSQLGIPFEAFEDLSIRLLAPAPHYILAALNYLHTING